MSETMTARPGKAARKRSAPVPKHKANGAGGPVLTRADILGADDLITETVSTPEWGGDVLVRALPLAEQGLFEADAAGDRDNVAVLTRMVALCACDAVGARLFTLEDVEALGRKAAEPVMRVARAAIRINALTEHDVQDLAKN